MSLQDLLELYEYGYWANGKLFDAIAELTPEQFTQSVGGSYGSIRNTLVHALSAEWGWLDRCGGAKRGPALTPEEFPNIAFVRETWAGVERNVRDFLAGLMDADLEREVSFSLPGQGNRTMKLGQLLRHAAIHGVHHRGQVALLLRMLGQAPGNVDLLLYYADGSERGRTQ